jgi:hypothetical protein
MLKNSIIHAQRQSRNNPRDQRHQCDRLWSFPGDFNRKFEHALHLYDICSPTLDKTTEFVTSNMVIIPHPPYSQDLVP